MKTNVSIVSILLLALTVATATQARAQVGWSSIARGCVYDTTNLASIAVFQGSVFFSADGSGHIKLICPVQGIFGVPQNFVNDLVITFYNDNGFEGGVDHCSIEAHLFRTNLNNIEAGADITTITTAGRAFTGRQTLDRGLPEFLNFDTSYYWVDIDMFRDSGSATCHPEFVGTYLTQIIF